MQTLSGFVPWRFGANLQASALPQVASTEEDGRVAAIAVFLNCFACSELWATSEFALV